MKKKYIILFFVIILLIIFAICYYNTSNFGNNISVNNENKVVDYILNINDYEAEIEVTVESNKTTNIYELKQCVSGDSSSLEVLSKGKIGGLKIEFKDKTLKVQNTELKLDKIYENYEPLVDNLLFLNTFKESDSTTYMEGNFIVFEIPRVAKLYVDMKDSKPTKLEIKDNTKKTNICINYNSI